MRNLILLLLIPCSVFATSPWRDLDLTGEEAKVDPYTPPPRSHLIPHEMGFAIGKQFYDRSWRIEDALVYNGYIIWETPYKHLIELTGSLAETYANYTTEEFVVTDPLLPPVLTPVENREFGRVFHISLLYYPINCDFGGSPFHLATGLGFVFSGLRWDHDDSSAPGGIGRVHLRYKAGSNFHIGIMGDAQHTRLHFNDAVGGWIWSVCGSASWEL